MASVVAAVNEFNIKQCIEDIYSRLEDLTFGGIFKGYVLVEPRRTLRPVYEVTNISANKLLDEIHHNVTTLASKLGSEIWTGITWDDEDGICNLWGTPDSVGYSDFGIRSTFHIPVDGIKVIVGATGSYLALVNITVEQGEWKQLSVSNKQLALELCLIII